MMAFPLVPSTLRRSAVVAFATAAMGPASMAIAAALGRTVPEPAVAAFFYIPLFVGALVVTLVSGVVYRLSIDVSRAQKLGAYTLVKKIAQGGMGEVWEARHGSLIRPAAIKLIRAESLGDKSTEEMTVTLRRFVREAQSTASLSSPHTVALYDFGRTDGGTVYYVMELLGGMDLESLVRRFGPLPASRVVSILAQALESLAEAHRHGLVHRDIKPANLQLAVIGGRFDFVKVLDFGLVKHLGGAGPMVSADSVITGTPAYLSPEAASGGSAVDARSDLYALGCVAYWLLTGKLVFDERTPVAMILAHLKNEPVPPSLRSELPIPPELERLVLDLLAKDPEQRPASAEEVSRRLAAIALEDAWTQERAERWWRAHVPDEVGRNDAETCASGGEPELGDAEAFGLAAA
jgi:serine/threonine-protein kinase